MNMSLRKGMVSLLVAWVVAGTGCWGPTFPVSAYDKPNPPGSRLIQPPLPQAIRHFVLSQDRHQVAYVADVSKPPYELVIATLGGQVQKRATVDPNIEQLQWSADGRSLIYMEREERVIPGEFSDFGLPKMELVAVRIKSLPVKEGEPQTLLTLPPGSDGMARALSFQVQPNQPALILAVPEETIGHHVTILKRLDLASGALRQLAQRREIWWFAVSPDGEQLAFLDTDSAGRLTVLGLQTGETKVFEATTSGPIMWLPSSQGLLQVDSQGNRHQLKTVSLAGETHTIPVAIDVPNLQINGADSLSPNGKRLWAFGPSDTNLIISLVTGKVVRLESFGYLRGWLDNETVIGTYRGGQYAVGVPAD
jgi:hypothetical protein